MGWIGEHFLHESASLRDLVSSLSMLSPHHRKLVAEMIMIRLFLLGENSISLVCQKLVCGADYLDNSSPITFVTASSRSNAETLMKCYGRARPKHYLSWTRSNEINDNLKHTLKPDDPAFSVFSKNAALLTEMRYVRNHIAHRSDSTRRHFRKVVRQHYGGLKRGVTPDVLLLTGALGATPLLERYFAYYRIVLKDLVRA